MTKRIILGAVAILLVIASAYASFFIAPQERTMGLIQRIFYFHAATAWAGEMTFFVCFLSNLLYVWKRQPKYDWLGVSSAGAFGGPGTLASPPPSSFGCFTCPIYCCARLSKSQIAVRCSAHFSGYSPSWMSHSFFFRSAGGAPSIRNLSSWAAPGPVWTRR